MRVCVCVCVLREPGYSGIGPVGWGPFDEWMDGWIGWVERRGGLGATGNAGGIRTVRRAWAGVGVGVFGAWLCGYVTNSHSLACGRVCFSRYLRG